MGDCSANAAAVVGPGGGYTKYQYPHPLVSQAGPPPPPAPSDEELQGSTSGVDYIAPLQLESINLYERDPFV